jgi:phenylalanyl-tRNA synthetase beta chain
MTPAKSGEAKRGGVIFYFFSQTGPTTLHIRRLIDTMKISFNWLKDYIQISEHPEKVAQRLTQSGLEVVSMTTFEPVKDILKGLVIGQIMTCEKHPNADRLKVTLVDIGQSAPLRIVCGAPNVQAGEKVVVAPVGALLCTNEGVTLRVKKAKIRGEVSEGMICAEDEIGLGHAHDGIIILNTPLAPGTSATQHFNTQPDIILEIDLTPNRADAFSHLGTARELSALLDRTVRYPSVEEFEATMPTLPMQVDVLDHSACPRYSGITISGVRVQPSPPWLENRLRAIGIIPVNNVVDVTNFVLHELGQPIHAFDYDQIIGKKITVKQLEPETPFITPDGKTIKLSGAELMVCDEAGGIGMAGILGGKRTSVHPDTQNIFLESAYFSPGVIRKAAKQHAIKTETSFHYERGTDPNITVYALKRACLLLQEIGQGTVVAPLIDLYPEKIEDLKVKVCYKNITRLLGLHIPKAVINKILSGLGIAISHEMADGFVASVPPYRVDVKREVDLIEEIARIYGYDRIEVTGKLGSTYLARTIQPEHNKLRHGVAELLAANGYHEIYTNSLTKSSYRGLTNALDAQQQVTILNPLSEALDALRTTLLLTGLEVLAHNINRKQTDLKLFEFGKIYHKESQQYVENNRLGIWLTGNIESINWIRKPREVTLQDMHAIIHKVLHRLHISDFSTHPIQTSLYQVGIQVALEQTQLLTAGKVHQSVLKHMGIHQSVFFADIDWDVLVGKWSPLTQFQEISKFPPVRRDISLVLDESVTFEEVNKVITQQNNKLIRSVAACDVYQGERLERGKKAYALSFVLQGKEKTLDDKTIGHVMACLMRAFEDQLGAVIRKQDA